MRRILQGLALLAASAPAFAHELITQYGAFLGPALHIFTEIDHLAAFAVLGLLAGQNQAPARTFGLVAFMGTLVLGMVAPLAFAGLGVFESAEGPLSAASVLVAAILIAVGKQLPVWLIAFVSTVLGLVHGIANGFAIAASPRLMVSVLGAGIAALVIAVVGVLIAAALSGPRGRLVVRVVGSWVAALSLLLIGLALRG